MGHATQSYPVLILDPHPGGADAGVHHMVGVEGAAYFAGGAHQNKAGLDRAAALLEQAQRLLGGLLGVHPAANQITGSFTEQDLH